MMPSLSPREAPSLFARALSFAVVLLLGLLTCLGSGGGGDTGGGGGGGTGATAPEIRTQPASASVAAGTAVQFFVVAIGDGLTYQWQRSDDGTTWNDVVGATNASIGLPPVSSSDDGARLRVVVNGTAGRVTSAVATLAVLSANSAPTIVTPPADASVVAPQPGSFTVASSGIPAPTVQWQISTDGGTTFSDIPGATAATYTTPATTLADNGRQYRAVATNSGGSATSAAATLTVVTASAGNRFVYVANSDSASVSGFRIDPTSGAASLTAGSPYPAVPLVRTLTLHPGGGFLYAGSGTGTTAFRIDASSGALTPVAGGPFAAGESQVQVVMHPSGRFLYFVGSNRGVAGYRIDAATGALAAMAGSPFIPNTLNINSRLTFEPNGRFGLVRGSNSALFTLLVNDSTGALTAGAGSPLTLDLASEPIPHPNGRHVLLHRTDQSLTPYAVDPGTGALTALAGFASTGETRINPVLHPDGRCLYYASGLPGTSGLNLLSLVFDGATGTLTASSAAPRSAGQLTLAPGGRFGYLDPDVNATAVDVDGASCAVTPSGGRRVFSTNHQIDRFDPEGRFIFALSLFERALYAYAVDGTTHQTTPVPGSPFATGATSGAVAGLAVR